MKEVINMNNKPIGVFDSGIGGVTVLDELVKDFPGENFIYVGDTLNLPYGTKTKDKLKELVSNVSNYLKERDRQIMILRYGLYNNEDLTQKEIALKLGISQSYISRIEKKVLSKLKSYIS